MDSCGSAHQQARELTPLGHNERLIPAMHFKPHDNRGKSNAIDAEAFCEAATRPKMRLLR